MNQTIIFTVNPSKTDITGTKTFVHYSTVSIAQGLVADHAPLPIIANCDGTRQNDNEMTKLTILTRALLI